MGWGGRQRAGHGHTYATIGDRQLKLIFSDTGKLIPTWWAQGWSRCQHCRRPYEVATFGFPICCSCFYYKRGYLEDVDEFWRLTNEKHPLAGYVLGEGFQRAIHCGFVAQLERHPEDAMFLLRHEQPHWVNQRWEGKPPRLGPLAIAMETRRAETPQSGSVAKP